MKNIEFIYWLKNFTKGIFIIYLYFPRNNLVHNNKKTLYNICG